MTCVSFSAFVVLLIETNERVAIIVQFDEKDYSGPSFCIDIPNCVPLYPVTNCSDALGQKLEKQQYPLKLAWSITIHKAQALALTH